MYTLASPDELTKAATHLTDCDLLLAPIVAAAGLAKLTPHTDYYGALVDSIISQQLSVKAAASIEKRFRDLFGGVFPAPEKIIEKSHEALRSVGLSNAKAN